MQAAKMHDQVDDKSLHVMALLGPEGWLYLAEVIDAQADGEIRTRAVNRTPFPSAVSALAQGMAHARWIATNEAGGFDPAAEVATERRPH